MLQKVFKLPLKKQIVNLIFLYNNSIIIYKIKWDELKNNKFSGKDKDNAEAALLERPEIPCDKDLLRKSAFT